MRSERTDIALRDILHHINLATRFIEGFDRESFKADIRAFYAVTRCPEIISESSRRLPDELKARHPEISWKQMAASGNVYRHDYEDVIAHVVCDTVERSLPPLRVVIEKEIARQKE
jgi:uncharacterized protein with HEPN domain